LNIFLALDYREKYTPPAAISSRHFYTCCYREIIPLLCKKFLPAPAIFLLEVLPGINLEVTDKGFYATT
jgi:hypothetical protein